MFSEAAKKTMSRRQELKDIMDGLNRMGELQREREDELKAIEKFLLHQRKYLPKATAVAIDFSTAASYARAIHARFVADELIEVLGKQRLAVMEAQAVSHLLTPAQKLRRRAQSMPHAGYGKLSIQESVWVAYDRVRCPEEWEEYSSGEEEDEEDEEDGGHGHAQGEDDGKTGMVKV